MVLFFPYRTLLVKPPNTFVTIARYNAIKETILPHAFKSFPKLPTEYGSDRFLGTKCFLATSLFTSASQTVSRMLTSLFNDVIMSSSSGFPGSESSLSLSFSCILKLFTVHLSLICEYLGLITFIPALHITAYDIFPPFIFWAGMDDDVTFFSPFEKGFLNILTVKCSPLDRSSPPS